MIESLPNQMPLFAEEEPGALFPLDAEQSELLGDIATLPEAAVRSLLALLLIVQFAEAFEETDEPAVEACAWRTEILPRCIRRRALFC